MFRVINNLRQLIQNPISKKLVIISPVVFYISRQAPNLHTQPNQSSYSQSKPNQSQQQTQQPFKMDKSELKKRLTPIQWSVTQEADTERPYTGEYDKHFEKGEYLCIVCDDALFKSDSKFNSGCGWPAFSSSEKGKVKENVDHTHGMVRTEVVCQKCGAHLGHVFNDGPKDKGGVRYCINSASLNFKKQ